MDEIKQHVGSAIEFEAALFVEGKVVVGENHGVAFGKLSSEDQNSNLVSGFFNPQTKKFIDEECKVMWLKKIVLIRHAHVNNLHLTEIGHQQTSAMSDFLFENIDLNSFEFITSPIDRCVETVQDICGKVSKDFHEDNGFIEKQEHENPGEFIDRLCNSIDHLPENSVVCTHFDCIFEMLSFLSNNRSFLKIPHCSSSYIENGAILWSGKSHGLKFHISSSV